MKRTKKNLTRVEYLKTMLESMGKQPKHFMFEVTCNTPLQTTLYHRINQLYKDGTPLRKAKKIISRLDKN